MQVVSTRMLDGRIWVSSFRYLSTEESSSRQARVLPPPSWLVSSIKDIWQLHDSLSFFSCPPPTLFPPFSLQVLNWHPSIIFDVCDCYIFGKWRGKITASICQGFTCIFQLVIVADKKDVVLLFGKRGELISLLLFSGKIAIIFALGKNQGSNNWIKGVKISASMVNPFPLCGFSFGGYSEGSKCC